MQQSTVLSGENTVAALLHFARTRVDNKDNYVVAWRFFSSNSSTYL